MKDCGFTVDTNIGAQILHRPLNQTESADFVSFNGSGNMIEKYVSNRKKGGKLGVTLGKTDEIRDDSPVIIPSRLLNVVCKCFDSLLCCYMCD